MDEVVPLVTRDLSANDIVCSAWSFAQDSACGT